VTDCALPLCSTQVCINGGYQSSAGAYSTSPWRRDAAWCLFVSLLLMIMADRAALVSLTLMGSVGLCLPLYCGLSFSSRSNDVIYSVICTFLFMYAIRPSWNT